MLVETASVEDCRAIAELHVTSWQVAYAGIVSASYLSALSVEQREAAWVKQLSEGLPEVSIARASAGIVGFVSYGLCRDSDKPANWGEVWALYVMPSHWSTGVGRALWLAALAALRARGISTVTLWVLALNVRGIKFYEAMGFTREPASEKTFRLGEQELEEIRLVYRDGA